MSESINIPGYRIERKLGQGGMAAVHLAIQRSFEREVALKIMSPLLNSDPSFTTRFIREARIVAHIHHASIVPVFDVGEHQPYHYLSMEYLPGGDLKQRILAGTCTPQLLFEVCAALCAALDVAHRKGFVHRDIKPENILFREDGTPVLTDFGIARAVDSGTSLTVAGMLVGTPSYMSPEQVKGQELDGRSDLYSLGIVCYEMLTGTVPFRADSTMSVAIKHLIEPLPPLPAGLAAYQSFMDRLTAKDRNDRFASGAEIMQALRAVRTTGSSVTLLRPLPDRSRTQSPRTAASRYDVAAVMASVSSAASAAASSVASAASSVASAAVSTATATRSAAATLRTRLAHAWAQRRRPVLPSAIVLPRWDRQTATWAGAVASLAVLVAFVAVLSREDAEQTAQTQAGPAPDAAAVVARAPTPPSETEDTSAPAAPLSEEATQTDGASQDAAAEAARLERLAAERSRRAAERQRLDEERQQRELQAQAAAQRSRDEQVQKLLAEGRSAYAAGSLALPSGASAADRYKEVLQLQPDQSEAIAGLQRIANVLVEEALHARSVGNAESLRRLIPQIAWVKPGHQKLVELQAGLTQLMAEPAELSRRQAANLERAARYMARAREYLDREPFDMRAAHSAADQYDRAVSAAPMAPGLPSLKERLIAAYPEAARTELAGHDTKRALRLIEDARKRDWISADLEAVETRIRTGTTSLQ